MTEEENTVHDPEAGSAETQNVLGKFQSVDALARAYRELEAEFTRRSQRLKALEAAAPPHGSGNGSGAHTAEGGSDDEALYRAVSGNEGVCARIVGDYLASLRGVPLMAGGGAGVTAPVSKAKSVKEAGALALGYLRNQKL